MEKWISVKDKLPPKHIRVLVFDGCEISIDFICLAGHWFEAYKPGMITHWQYLPSLPIVEEKI
jgi:hypothetical protein